VLFSPTVHVVLLSVGLIGIVVLGLAFRRERAWPALLLWVVPAVLTLSAADGALQLLSGLWPAAAMDGGRGDVVRYVLACGILLPPVEIFYQLLTTTLARRGIEHTEAVRSE
jgi:hypothetical protein